MKNNLLPLISILAALGGTSSANGQNASASDNLTAQPVADRIVPFRLSDEGVRHEVEWGTDVAWMHEQNLRRCVLFMGKDNVAVARVSFQPTYPLVDGDLQHTVFSYIPNTAETAFLGMLDAFKTYLNQTKIAQIEALDHKPTHEELEQILSQYVRSEKVAIKDIKLRTFITEGASRNDLAAHVYDITYGSLRAGEDNLVIIDDSIVRGTTLRESIIRILDRLHPRKIVIVSSSPQVRYPDYYGIDMANMDEFIAFRAAIELLKDRGMAHLVGETYERCKAQLARPKNEMENCVKDIYAPFTDEDISRKMMEMLRPEGVTTPIEIVYQTLDGLHKACPDHKGDWYFSGDYPTPGGVKLVNRAFVDYYENVFKVNDNRN